MCSILSFEIQQLQWNNQWKHITVPPAACLCFFIFNYHPGDHKGFFSLSWQAAWEQEQTSQADHSSKWSFTWSASKIVHVHLNKMYGQSFPSPELRLHAFITILMRIYYGPKWFFRHILRKTSLFPHCQLLVSSSKWVLCYVWRCADYWLFTHSH